MFDLKKRKEINNEYIYDICNKIEFVSDCTSFWFKLVNQKILEMLCNGITNEYQNNDVECDCSTPLLSQVPKP
jgi:hypothetical protein